MPRVLVVDDDEALREAVAEAITDAGYQVEQAENGRDALDKMRTVSPCVVLLDLMMPVMDGWEVVSHMSADPDLARVPICIVTAQDQLAPPPNSCLLKKPLRVDDLLRTISVYCGKP